MAVVTDDELVESFGQGFSPPKVGDLRLRKVVVNGVEKEIPLPTIAGCGFTKEDLDKELTEAGFRVKGAQRKKTRPHGICWIIIAQKTSEPSA
jgi:hypothetical protein